MGFGKSFICELRNELTNLAMASDSSQMGGGGVADGALVAGCNEGYQYSVIALFVRDS